MMLVGGIMISLGEETADRTYGYVILLLSAFGYMWGGTEFECVHMMLASPCRKRLFLKGNNMMSIFAKVLAYGIWNVLVYVRLDNYLSEVELVKLNILCATLICVFCIYIVLFVKMPALGMVIPLMIGFFVGMGAVLLPRFVSQMSLTESMVLGNSMVLFTILLECILRKLLYKRPISKLSMGSDLYKKLQ